MYLAHYNLNDKPFQITTDPKFLWLGEKHQEALSVLKYGMIENKGFLLLTGEVGTGKTVLINCLETSVDIETVIATIPDPDLDTLDFFNFLSDGFQMGKRFDRKGDFLLELRNFLHESYAKNKKVLLIIDESQRLNSELLEEIRLLSNIELHNRKLINIFFVGQNEFHRTLLEERNKAVTQRIGARYNIEPLTETETGEYIKHRLKIAGTEKKIFKASAIHEVFSFSGGVPRLINIMCDHALLTGYALEKKSIDARMINECAVELRIPVQYSRDEDRLQQTLDDIRKEIVEGLRQDPKSQAKIVASENFNNKERRKNATRPAQDNREKTVEKKKPPSKREAPSRQTAPPEKRPLWIRAGYAGIVLVLVLVGGYLLKNYEPQKTREWELEDLAPNKYKDSLKKEELSLRAELSGEQESSAAPPVQSEQTDRTVVAEPKAIQPLAKPATGSNKLNYPETQPDEKSPGSQSHGASIPGQAKALKAPEKRTIIPFGHDSNDIPDNSFATLDRVAVFLIQNPGSKLKISGYTDSYGAVKYNIRISEFRANTIKSYLVGKGADPSKITTIGRGPENPIATNQTPEGREANRRVELELTTDN